MRKRDSRMSLPAARHAVRPARPAALPALPARCLMRSVRNVESPRRFLLSRRKIALLLQRVLCRPPRMISAETEARKSNRFSGLFCVPGMTRFLRVKVPPRVFTAKCSEPQAANSNGRRGGSGVAKPRSLRTETGYKAKRWVRLHNKPKPKR